MRQRLTEINIVLAIIAIIVLNVGFPDRQFATKFLEQEGFTGIDIKGRTFFGCGKGFEFWRTEFEATNSRGIRIHGVICDGLTSDAYIRRK
ncbi:hypothetical protein D3C78_835380 [compost metagenome]